MLIFRARHDNTAPSPMRTLYGRKGNLLLFPLDVCILQFIEGGEEFRPVLPATRLIAAPVQEDGGRGPDGPGTRRIGLIAHYEWPPLPGAVVNPVVTAQAAPSASLKGIPDIAVIAPLVELGDRILLDS